MKTWFKNHGWLAFAYVVLYGALWSAQTQQDARFEAGNGCLRVANITGNAEEVLEHLEWARKDMEVTIMDKDAYIATLHEKLGYPKGFQHP